MRCWYIPGAYHATLVYRNRGYESLHDETVKEVSAAQGGRILGAAQCLFTGQRVLGLAFPSDKQRDIACSGLAEMFSGFRFPDDGEEGDPG